MHALLERVGNGSYVRDMGGGIGAADALAQGLWCDESGKATYCLRALRTAAGECTVPDVRSAVIS